jgi:hypothetical protein
MEQLIALAIANPEISVPVILGAVDIIAGWLPDRFTKWPGLILAGASKAYHFGKETVETVEAVKGLDVENEADVAKLYAALVRYRKALKAVK